MIHNGETYQTNYQRAAFLLASTCAAEPKDCRRAKAWRFIKSVYNVFCNKPEALGLKVCEDVYFTRWEQQKGREQDVKSIRGAIDKIMGVIGLLQTFVKLSEWEEDGLTLGAEQLKISPLFYKVLEQMPVAYRKKPKVTIVMDKGCAAAFKELAAAAEKHAIDLEGKKHADYESVYFSRIVFEAEKDWLTPQLDQMMKAEGRLEALCKKLSEKGFYHQVFIDGRRLSMNYLKDCVKNPGPLRMAFGERSRIGIEASIEDIHLDAVILSLRLPNYREVLEKFAEFSAELQKFILAHTKTCDGCRYCVQTDKSGIKPLAAAAVSGMKKCPLFPAFSYSFSELSEEDEKMIVRFLEAVF